MAKTEHDREDLLTEGVNMPVRGQFCDAENRPRYFVGWRKDGGVRIFDDDDPVFQFDDQDQLRRVYFNQQKLLSQGGTLVRLERVKQVGDQFAHHTVTMDEREIANVMAQWQSLHRGLLQLSERGKLQCVGTSELEFRTRLRNWLRRVTETPRLTGVSSD